MMHDEPMPRSWYHWLGYDADAARCEEETRQRQIAELPELDGTDDDG